MDRRRFLLTSLAGALAGPLGALAQQGGKVYRIGALWTNPDARGEDVLRQGLRDLGWVEGQNVILERRYAEGRNERHPAHAAELVRLQPDLIITVGTPATLAAKEATTTIPIVFILVADPVGSNLVGSLARPGGNITGIAGSGPQIFGKYVELLREAVPSLSRVGVVINSTFSVHVAVRPVVEAAAQNLNLRLIYVEVRTRRISTAPSRRSPEKSWVGPSFFRSRSRSPIALGSLSWPSPIASRRASVGGRRPRRAG
jgi:putative ABC transport system substrate-binding protein